MLLLAATATADAQERQHTSIEDPEILVTALKVSRSFGEKSGIPLEHVPQSLQLLTKADFLERGAQSIFDGLLAVPSAEPGPPRATPFPTFAVTLRGFKAGQIRNGVRQRYFDLVDPSALSNIDRVEVLKGPSAVLYGQSALGGILSIVTKRPEPAWSAEVSVAPGSFAEARGSLDLTGPLAADGALGFRLTGELERSDTQFDFIDLKRNNVALALTAAPVDGMEGHLSLEWQERHTIGNPGLPVVGTVVPNGIAPIPRRRVLTEPAIANLDLSAPLVQAWMDVALPGGWTATPRVSWNRYDEDLSRIVVGAVLADRRTVQRRAFSARERDHFLVTQLDLAGRLRLAGMAHQLLLGGEWADERNSFTQAQPASVPPIDALQPVYGRLPTQPYRTTFVFSGDLTSYAVYGQDLLDVTERLQLVAGVRYATFDTVTRSSGQPDPSGFDSFTWSVGATWRLGRGLSLFGGYSTGFDVENVIGGRSATGKQFAPETSAQGEIGLRFRSSGVGLTASVFEIRRADVLTADPENPDFNIQAGRQRVRGVELQGEWRPARALTLTGGYALLDSEVVASTNGDQGQAIANVPRHRGNLSASWQTTSWLVLRAGTSYVGGRRFSNIAAPVAPGLLATSIRLPDYATLNVGAQARAGTVLVDLSITNALDARYFQAPGPPQTVYPGEPLAVTVRLNRRF